MEGQSSSVFNKVKNMVGQTASPQIVVSIIPSSTTFSLNSQDSQDKFSITLEAFVTGTDSQPLTVYTKDSLLQPSAVRANLEKRGLVFTDVKTGGIVKNTAMGIKSINADASDNASEASSFVELPASEEGQGKAQAASYKVTYQCERTALKGLKEGKDYRVSLGDGLAKVKWWKIGSLEDVLDKGMRKLVKLQTQDTPSSEELKMRLASGSSFHVTG